MVAVVVVVVIQKVVVMVHGDRWLYAVAVVAMVVAWRELTAVVHERRAR